MLFSITTDGITMISANKAFYDFFELSSKEEFIQKYGSACICETFESDDNYEYLQKNSKLIVDTRGRFKGSHSNIISA